MEKIPAVKYMRDFYPDDMRLRLWIEDRWRRASRGAGYQEWDAPIMEYLDLYTRKSGAEIVGQLFAIAARPGDAGAEYKEERPKAIRPEMTPSLARMIAAKQAALPKPIKWFCIARMCRSERGQRGRLREFWQWNADILGVEDASADAEVISTALDGLMAMGLSADDLEVRLNSRTLLAGVLEGLGVAGDNQAGVYAALDKRGKVPADVQTEMLRNAGLSETGVAGLDRFMACGSIADVQSLLKETELAGCETPLAQLARVFDCLDALGKADFVRFDPTIVRGLAYYTGPVFEIFDKRANLRAIAGGGRYDNLLSVMGGQPMPAVGFGMGDVVLAELLKETGKLPSTAATLDDYVIPLAAERFADALRLAAKLRAAGRSVDYPPAPGNLGKLMKKADALGAQRVILVGGDEWEAGCYRVRDMAAGSEKNVPFAEIR